MYIYWQSVWEHRSYKVQPSYRYWQIQYTNVCIARSFISSLINLQQNWLCSSAVTTVKPNSVEVTDPRVFSVHDFQCYFSHIVNIDIASHPVTFYSLQWGNQPYLLDLAFKCWVLSKEASSTIFEVFGITRPGIEPTTSRTPGEHSTTRPPGVVLPVWEG